MSSAGDVSAFSGLVESIIVEFVSSLVEGPRNGFRQTESGSNLLCQDTGILDLQNGHSPRECCPWSKLNIS